MRGECIKISRVSGIMVQGWKGSGRAGRQAHSLCLLVIYLMKARMRIVSLVFKTANAGVSCLQL